MKLNKKLITVAIDSPGAAGAGTQAKLIAKEYNLFYLDTGKISEIQSNLTIELRAISKQLSNLEKSVTKLNSK